MAATRPGPGWEGFARRVLDAHRVDLTRSQERQRPTCHCGAPAELCGVRAAAREYGLPIPDIDLDARRYPRGARA